MTDRIDLDLDLDLDLREVTKADVYIGEVLAVHLTRGHGDAVSFDYVAEETGEGRVRDRSVSWSLLRSGEYPVITAGGAVPPSSRCHYSNRSETTTFTQSLRS